MLYHYQCKVVRVIDADTLVVNIDLGFKTWHETTIRLHGVDAPEMGTPLGRVATDYVRDWVSSGGPLFELVTIKDKKDKYGRYLGLLMCSAQNGELERTLNSDLRIEGHVKQ